MSGFTRAEIKAAINAANAKASNALALSKQSNKLRPATAYAVQPAMPRLQPAMPSGPKPKPQLAANAPTGKFQVYMNFIISLIMRIFCVGHPQASSDTIVKTPAIVKTLPTKAELKSASKTAKKAIRDHQKRAEKAVQEKRKFYEKVMQEERKLSEKQCIERAECDVVAQFYHELGFGTDIRDLIKLESPLQAKLDNAGIVNKPGFSPLERLKTYANEAADQIRENDLSVCIDTKRFRKRYRGLHPILVHAVSSELVVPPNKLIPRI